MTVAEATNVVEKARQTVASTTVFIRSNKTGVWPMERRLEDGSRRVSTCDYSSAGKMTNIREVRPLNFGSNGVMVLNPQDRDDMDLLAEVEALLEDGDARALEAGIQIQRGGTVEGAPIPMYDKRKPENIIARLTEDIALIAEDPQAVRDLLEACARYELQREERLGKKPRAKLLDAFNELGDAVGIEYGTDAVEEV